MNLPDTEFLSKIEGIEALSAEADPPVSEARLRGLLEGARDLTGQNRGHLVEILALIARTEAQQGKFSEARKSLEEADLILKEEAALAWVAPKIRWLIEKGRLNILEKTPSQARILFSEAWNLAVNSNEDFFAVELTQLMAMIEPQKVQQEWIHRGIEIAEKSKLAKAKSRLGTLYMTLGWKLYELRQFEKSTGLFERALKEFKNSEKKREAFIAEWSIGKVLRVLGKTEAALALQQRLLAELGLSGQRDGRLYEELAECLQTLKRTEEAQSYFGLAYKEFSSDEWVTDNQPVRLKRMKDLGKIK
ncbi:MAG: hypothetical protein AABZ55_13775 [Bdellovibrionota bacterium]